MPHGNTGNQNALKAVKKDAFINFRVTSKTKAKATADAQRRGISVSDYLALLIEAQK